MMERIHAQVLRSSDAVHFVTLFLARLDPGGDQLEYVSAGHNPAIILEANGDVRTLAATGVPAGLIPGATFGAASIDLRPGSTVCIYSDGVTEAQDEGGEDFGAERLIAALKKRHDRPLAETLSGLLQDLQAFLGERAADDDVTLLLLRRTAK
jgi:sigma-B regulation protein RsbU (phosphoserine phosphatase)